MTDREFAMKEVKVNVEQAIEAGRKRAEEEELRILKIMRLSTIPPEQSIKRIEENDKVSQ